MVDLKPDDGYEYIGEWELDKKYTNCDDQGWSYAQDMWNLSANFKAQSSYSKATPTTWTRRRKWSRRQVEKPVALSKIIAVDTGLSSSNLKKKGEC